MVPHDDRSEMDPGTGGGKGRERSERPPSSLESAFPHWWQKETPWRGGTDAHGRRKNQHRAVTIT